MTNWAGSRGICSKCPTQWLWRILPTWSECWMLEEEASTYRWYAQKNQGSSLCFSPLSFFLFSVFEILLYLYVSLDTKKHLKHFQRSSKDYICSVNVHIQSFACRFVLEEQKKERGEINLIPFFYSASSALMISFLVL